MASMDRAESVHSAAGCNATLWTDSALSILATEQNLQRNNRPAVPVIPSTQPPGAGYAAVVMKVPKQLPYFQYQLALLAASLPPGTPVFAGGMDKHLSPRTAAMLEQYIGPPQRHRGRLKARVFCAIRDERPAPEPPPDSSYFCEALGGDLTAMANVFSRDGLDIGSRFLIKQLGGLDPVDSVLDLACGNGLLGLVAHSMGLGKYLSFCDESAMAIASAKMNVGRLAPEILSNTTFHHGDGL